MLPEEASSATPSVKMMSIQFGVRSKYRKTTINSSSIVASKKELNPFIDLFRGKNAGRFCAPTNKLLMNGDEDNSASNQAEEIMTTLIEAIQLAQLSNICERM